MQLLLSVGFSWPPPCGGAQVLAALSCSAAAALSVESQVPGPQAESVEIYPQQMNTCLFITSSRTCRRRRWFRCGWGEKLTSRKRRIRAANMFFPSATSIWGRLHLFPIVIILLIWATWMLAELMRHCDVEKISNQPMTAGHYEAQSASVIWFHCVRVSPSHCDTFGL